MRADTSKDGVVGEGEEKDDVLGDPKAWPPGFRFHPTDEELILYYLKRKLCARRLKLNVIADIDVYKWDHPEELPAQSILKWGDRQWFFFSPRDRKYPNGARSNRATRHGYWKVTGKDRNITWNSRSVGVKKTLVFYKGRAPCGERTDWVMHEYTMDEEELKRCKNLQDYYALYKVFKKSGPGPKNGEQYGAPFREEDWVDDGELVEINTPKQVEDKTPKQDDRALLNDTAFVDIATVRQCQPSLDHDHDLDQFLKQFTAPVTNQPQQQPSNDFSYILRQFGLEGENQSTTLRPSFGEAISEDPVSRYPDMNQFDAQNATEVALSYLSSCEAPEVTSAANNFYQDPPNILDEGFLEINDLVDTLPTCSNVVNADENSHMLQGDRLDDPDLYFDAAMFLNDLGHIDQGVISDPYWDNVSGGLSSQSTYHPPSQFGQEDNFTNQLWTHDQRCDVFTLAEPNQVIVNPPTSASIGFHTGSSNSHPLVERQNHNQNEDGESGDIDSWFSSAISSFLGSVPARPAMASENALNRAFERMSSFSKFRILTRDIGSTPDAQPVVRRRVDRNGGFLYFSALGVVCAILWMLMIGTTVKVLKTFVGSFTSS